ncbi:hypothetical protein ACQ4PT_001864 [Festuca glaucescens]
MASYLHSLASSSSLDQVPFHPSSPITIPQICEIHPHVLGSALVWGEEGIHEGVDLLQRCDEMVPYYLGEMTEQVEQEDRIPVLKASQDHPKVHSHVTWSHTYDVFLDISFGDSTALDLSGAVWRSCWTLASSSPPTHPIPDARHTGIYLHCLLLEE